MKNREKVSRKLVAAPLILGIMSFLSFAVYLYSANTAPYSYIGVIYAGPVLSLIGVIISIITRKSRKTYPILWSSGLVLCLFGFVLCVLIIFVLMSIVMSMFNGTWL